MTLGKIARQFCNETKIKSHQVTDYLYLYELSRTQMIHSFFLFICCHQRIRHSSSLFLFFFFKYFFFFFFSMIDQPHGNPLQPLNDG
jgi:hypothetical protein